MRPRYRRKPVQRFANILARHQSFGQHLLDAAEGLAGPVFVLDEREADVIWPEDRMMAQTEEVVIGRGSASHGKGRQIWTLRLYGRY